MENFHLRHGRLLAVQQLGWTEVPVVVLHEFGRGLVERLLAERDENTCRKDFTPTEAVALGKKIKGMVKKEAKRRKEQAPGQPRGAKKPESVSPGNFPAETAVNKGRVRDHIGEALGMSGKTYEKAEAVADAAEEEPALYGDLPAKMDKKSVDAAYRELQRRKHPEPPEPEPRYPHSDSFASSWTRRRSCPPSSQKACPAPRRACGGACVSFQFA